MSSAAEIAADLITSFRSPSGQTGPPPCPAPPLVPTADPVFVPTDTSSRELDLLTTLRRRRSQRFFDDTAITIGGLLDTVRAGSHADARMWPEEYVRTPITIYALCFRVTGILPGIYALDAAAGTASRVADLPPAAELAELTLQAEFTQAPAIISLSANVAAATAIGGHGYRLLMTRAGATAYAMWLDGVSRAWTGSVFAGFIPASVRTALASDGVSRHQVFALALGHPARASQPPPPTGAGSVQHH